MTIYAALPLLGITGSSVAGGSRLGSPAWREAFGGISAAYQLPKSVFCHPSPLASPLSRAMHPRCPDTTCWLWHAGTAFALQDVTNENSQLRGSCDDSSHGSDLQWLASFSNDIPTVASKSTAVRHMALFICCAFPLCPLLFFSFLFSSLNHHGAPEHGRNKPSQWLNGPGHVLANHIARDRQGRPKGSHCPWDQGS